MQLNAITTNSRLYLCINLIILSNKIMNVLILIILIDKKKTYKIINDYFNGLKFPVN